MNSGIFVISLDFELQYGIEDLGTAAVTRYKRHILGGRLAIPQILDLFAQHGIHATWAAVGMLLCGGISDWKKHIPDMIPTYRNIPSIYQLQERLGISEAEDPLHYGRSLVECIMHTEGQELGSHTYSHYFCYERGQNVEQFSADLAMARNITNEKFGMFPISLVFPRNEVSSEYVAAARDAGFVAYRGCANETVYRGTSRNLLVRLLRLLDAYIGFSGSGAFSPCIEWGLCNVKASQFLRPYNRKFAFFEPLRLHRIKHGMLRAAKKGLCYHLWWHPHNFGKDTEENMKNLKELLGYFQVLKEKYGMRSKNMGEVAMMMNTTNMHDGMKRTILGETHIMTRNEYIKRLLKNCIPWRIRYYVKYLEGKGIRLPKILKQRQNMYDYNKDLYTVLSEFGISDFAGKTVLEMGCGQFLNHAFLAYQLGAEKEYLTEITDFVGVDSPASLDGLHISADYTALRPLPNLSDGETWRSYLAKVNTEFLCNGSDAYKNVPDDSVDYVFAFTVLQHIRKNEFLETMGNVCRFMRTGGMVYFTVDFRDMFGGGKNQLRFPSEKWEDAVHYRMENYTNRIHCSELQKIFEEVGFIVTKCNQKYFNHLPLKRKHLAAEFKAISDDDLRTEWATFVLCKK